MELTLRNPYIENWAIFLVFCQAVLIGIAYYRSYGGLFEAIIDTGRKTTLGSRIQLDELSRSLLQINNFIGVMLFLCWYLVDAFFINTALLYAAAGAAVFFVIWHVDYLLFWSISANRKNSEQYIGLGNVPWFLFGISLAVTNAILVFNKHYEWGGVAFFSLLTLVLLIRVVSGILYAVGIGFPWYYIILYLCSVYLLPIVLIQKLFRAFWSEILIY